MNPYHDRRGRFTTASGVGSGGTSSLALSPEYGRGKQRGTAKQTKLPFTVVWFEGSHANKQEKTFNSFEEAQAWARENLDPMTNGKVMPNLPDDLFDDRDNFDGRNYQGGVYSNKVNRYAAIVDTHKAASKGY